MFAKDERKSYSIFLGLHIQQKQGNVFVLSLYNEGVLR